MVNFYVNGSGNWKWMIIIGIETNWFGNEKMNWNKLNWNWQKLNWKKFNWNWIKGIAMNWNWKNGIIDPSPGTVVMWAQSCDLSLQLVQSTGEEKEKEKDPDVYFTDIDNLVGVSHTSLCHVFPPTAAVWNHPSRVESQMAFLEVEHSCSVGVINWSVDRICLSFVWKLGDFGPPVCVCLRYLVINVIALEAARSHAGVNTSLHRSKLG